MSRIAGFFLTVAAVAGLVALGVSQAQIMRLVGPERQTLLYDGDIEADSGGITVTPWGSGEAESVYEATYVGPEVLKVTSQGPHQGIVLHFNRPADLSEFVDSRLSAASDDRAGATASASPQGPVLHRRSAALFYRRSRFLLL